MRSKGMSTRLGQFRGAAGSSRSVVSERGSAARKYHLESSVSKQTFVVRWKIQGFPEVWDLARSRRLRPDARDQCLDSETFGDPSIGRWYLRMYPFGDLTNPGRVELYLMVDSVLQRDTLVKYKLQILSNCPGRAPDEFEDSDIFEKGETGVGYGPTNLCDVRTSRKMRSRVWGDGALYVKALLEFPQLCRNACYVTNLSREHEQRQSLGDDLATYIQRQERDTTIRFDNADIQVNRLVLKARSRVFEAMLKGPFKESTQQVIDIPNLGVSTETLKNLLEYMHTDSCAVFGVLKGATDGDGNSSDLGGSFAIDSEKGGAKTKETETPKLEDLVDMLVAADLYDVPCVYKTCVDKMTAMLNQTNFATILYCANRIRCKPLADAARQFANTLQGSKVALQMLRLLDGHSDLRRKRRRVPENDENAFPIDNSGAILAQRDEAGTSRLVACRKSAGSFLPSTVGRLSWHATCVDSRLVGSDGRREGSATQTSTRGSFKVPTVGTGAEANPESLPKMARLSHAFDNRLSSFSSVSSVAGDNASVESLNTASTSSSSRQSTDPPVLSSNCSSNQSGVVCTSRTSSSSGGIEMRGSFSALLRPLPPHLPVLSPRFSGPAPATGSGDDQRSSSRIELATASTRTSRSVIRLTSYSPGGVSAQRPALRPRTERTRNEASTFFDEADDMTLESEEEEESTMMEGDQDGTSDEEEEDEQEDEADGEDGGDADADEQEGPDNEGEEDDDDDAEDDNDEDELEDEEGEVVDDFNEDSSPIVPSQQRRNSSGRLVDDASSDIESLDGIEIEACLQASERRAPRRSPFLACLRRRGPGRRFRDRRRLTTLRFGNLSGDRAPTDRSSAPSVNVDGDMSEQTTEDEVNEWAETEEVAGESRNFRESGNGTTNEIREEEQSQLDTTEGSGRETTGPNENVTECVNSGGHAPSSRDNANVQENVSSSTPVAAVNEALANIGSEASSSHSQNDLPAGTTEGETASCNTGTGISNERSGNVEDSVGGNEDNSMDVELAEAPSMAPSPD